MFHHRSRLVLCYCFALLARLVVADEFDGPPINYLTAQPNNRVAQLIDRQERGEATLTASTPLETLRILLRELHVPESSQMLVFSKTSMQRDKISSRTPRALYF